MVSVIKINSKDNVAVAVVSLEAGVTVEVEGLKIEINQSVPQGHKFALRDIAEGSDIVKYGSPIGKAIKDIIKGDWVHTHNIKTKLEGKLEYTYDPVTNYPEIPLDAKNKTFQGYLRSDGKAGIRNEIWILPTVSCTNQTATLIAKAVQSQLADVEWGENIDGVYEFKHPYGCSQLGEDHLNTQKLLKALTKHPNAAGVLVLGLGCENNHVAEFKKVLGDYDETRIKFLVAQEVKDEIEEGAKLVYQLAEDAAKVTREELPISYLNIGLKCGGSDGFSGITANPLVGKISDLVIAADGTSVLTEVPEMFGAEHSLMNRAKDEKTFSEITTLINDFKDYFIAHDQPVYENPSPGNKEGGITTLEDKSLGCTEKGGTSQVVDVLEYGEQAELSGLNLLCSPGNDLIAATTLAAAGCQIVLFTTGRGTPFGTCVPTMKIATNTRLYEYKSNWMDFNAGSLLEGETFASAANRLLDDILATASGKQQTKSEVMEFREIAIWKSGVTL